MLKAVTADMFREQYADVFSGDSRWQALQVPTGDRFVWEPDSTYIRNPPFFEGICAAAGAADRHHRRACAGAARRQHHDRPHLAGRLDQEGQPGGQVSDRARRAAGRLQLLRRAPRQSRSDDARHVRERPPAEPARARHRGWLDHAPARRRRHDDLRRRHEVQGRGGAAGRAGGQGVRLRIVTRLGGERHAAARRPRRHRGELRAHSPQQPRQHGHSAAACSRTARTRRRSD